MSRLRRTASAAAVLALGALTSVLGFAAPAAAHVSIYPTEATPGGYSRFEFRLPTESETASTTKLEVVLPENAPIGGVLTVPVAGWTVDVQKRKLDPPVDVNGTPLTEAVSRIIWTASASAAVKPGEFQEFPVSLGPLPKVDRMVFKALQTYSDGNVVRWIDEPPAAGGEPPAHPAPVLTLAAAGGAAASPSAAATVAASAGSADAGDDGTATLLGAAGLAAGLAGFALGGAAYVRTRRQPASTD